MTSAIEIYWDEQDPSSVGWAYRTRDAEGHEESGSIDDLDDLLRVLREMDGSDTWDALVVIDESGRRGSWDLLPTFGGEGPEDTQGVWSWDADRMLVGTCPRDYAIVPRA